MQYSILTSNNLNSLSKYLVILVGISPINSFALNETDIQNAVEKVKKDQRVVLIDKNNSEQTLIIKNQYFRYLIDMRAESCFVGGLEGGNFKPFSCASIKKGYPLYAPLITWE